MAKIGLSKPYYAIYSNTGTTVTYSKGGVIGKYTEFSLELEDGDNNILYADNGPAESDNSFAGGTATVTTDDLIAERMLAILGLKKEAITTPELSTKDAYWLVFDDDQDTPYIGLGGIIKKKINNATKYQAFILTKIQFTNPGLEAVTQGETIEWQTQELSATIMRSDEAKARWFMISNELDSEEDAEKIIKAHLNITDTPSTNTSAPGA